MCLQPNCQTGKKVSTPASLKFPQAFTPGYGQGQAGQGANGFSSPPKPRPSPDPMTRWLREPPEMGPWHGFDVPAYSGQKDVSHPKQRAATSSSTGATAGGEKRRAEAH